MKLAQVNVNVSDFPRMLDFYRDVLGLEVVPIEPGPPCDPLVNWDGELLRGTNRDAVQLAFLVDDAASERERLTAAGVRCDPLVEEGWGRYTSFTDPEGNRLQLFQLRPH
jgi:catechol 2,3-dioxygenase-like lactoylglutathione lyase family enzyme